MADESPVVQETDSSLDDIGDISLDALNEGDTPEPTEPSPVEEKTTETTDEEADSEPQTPED